MVGESGDGNLATFTSSTRIAFIVVVHILHYISTHCYVIQTASRLVAQARSSRPEILRYNMPVQYNRVYPPAYTLPRSLGVPSLSTKTATGLLAKSPVGESVRQGTGEGERRTHQTPHTFR